MLLRSSHKADPKPKGRRVPRLLLSIIFTTIILATIIPLAVMFRKKKAAPPRANVLVPLYVYPSTGAWDPLFTAITSHPELDFTVVVNPASGPGEGAGPDANYTREIPRLNSFGNVQAVGYVSTSWTNRDISLALRDIAKYSAWSENATVKGLGVKGIFLDETPASYNDASAQFLESLSAAIKSESGFGPDPLIIHNPGTMPDARYMPFCSISVVFEGTYSTYQIYGFPKTISAFQTSANCSREAIACIIHSLPSTLSPNDQKALITDLRALAGGIFVTGLAVDYYASFWAQWATFVGEMAA